MNFSQQGADAFESCSTDKSEKLIISMDLMPLIAENPLEPQALDERYLRGVQDEVSARLRKLSSR